MSASIDTLSRSAPAIPQGSDDEHRAEWLGIGLQVAFAERIARIKRIAVPDEAFRDRGLMSRWITSHKL